MRISFLGLSLFSFLPATTLHACMLACLFAAAAAAAAEVVLNKRALHSVSMLLRIAIRGGGGRFGGSESLAQNGATSSGKAEIHFHIGKILP